MNSATKAASYLTSLSVTTLRGCLIDDMEMLRHGEWAPDDDSIDAHIALVDELARRSDTLRAALTRAADALEAEWQALGRARAALNQDKE